MEPATILVVFVSHGAGGDIGEPAFLTYGGDVMNPQRTGLSMDAFGSAMTPRTPEQNIVVVIDASHDLSLNGVALIGPAATDWTQLPDWGVAVTSKSSGLGGPEGLIVPAVRDALSGGGGFAARPTQPQEEEKARKRAEVPLGEVTALWIDSHPAGPRLEHDARVQA